MNTPKDVAQYIKECIEFYEGDEDEEEPSQVKVSEPIVNTLAITFANGKQYIVNIKAVK